MPETYQPTFVHGELTPLLHYASDLQTWKAGASLMRNFIVLVQGGACSRPGTQYIGTCKFSDRPTRLLPFQFSVGQTYILEMGDHYIRIISDGAYLTVSGAVYELASPYAAADLAGITYAQSSDVLTLAHVSYPPMELRRLGQTNWQLVGVSFGARIAAPAGLALATNYGSAPAIQSTPAPALLSYSYAVSSVSITTADQSNISAAVGGQNYDLGYWNQYGVNNKLTWQAVAGADYYNVWRNWQGVWSFIGSTVDTSFEDDNFLPDDTNTPPQHRDPLAALGNPGCVGFYQQRRWFGGSAANPQTLEGSQSGNYANFDVAQPARASDAITLTIAAQQLNAIQHILPVQDLLLFTSGGVWWVNGGQTGTPVTPSAADAQIQVREGASGEVVPLQIVRDALYVDVYGVPRALKYDLYVNGYQGTNLSVLAEHLFKGRQIVQWVWAEAPFKVVWGVGSDGVLLGMTYLQEQQVLAWHHHDTAGLFQSIATVPEDLGYGTEDAVYVVVNRTVQGQTVAMVERFHTRQLGAADNDLSTAWCVDAGLQYSGSPVITVAGLSYLEGCQVVALADGNVITGLVVANGGVTLPYAASTITVGLPFQPQVQTLPLDIGQPQSVLGKRRRISKVRLMVRNTRGLKVGCIAGVPTDPPLAEMRERFLEAPGAPTSLTTGSEQIIISPRFDYEQRVLCQQDFPLPVTILGLMPEWDTEQ